MYNNTRILNFKLDDQLVFLTIVEYLLMGCFFMGGGGGVVLFFGLPLLYSQSDLELLIKNQNV